MRATKRGGNIMFLRDEYFFHRLSYELVNEHNFQILLLAQLDSELWLEKRIAGQNHIIRLSHHQFDWKNHLLQDITNTFSQLKKLRQLIVGRNVIFHNVYVATHPPVDDWETLKKPTKGEGKKFTEHNLYYMDEAERELEKIRLFQRLGVHSKIIEYPDSELEMERLTQYIKTMIAGKYHNEKKETEKLFRNGKPFITLVLLIINLIVFMIVEKAGGSTSPSILIEYGAKYNPAIIEGEWWRIITSMFLHIGMLHLIMNMFALYYVGSVVERIFGSIRFIVIYFLSGIIGGLTSFALNPQIAAGASGAIFGLFGALLFFGVNYRKVFFKTMGWNVIFVICFNILFGFTISQIDNGAHIGGLLGGFMAASIVQFPNKKRFSIQILSFILYTTILGSLVYYGTINTNPMVQLQDLEKLIAEKKFEEAIELTDEALESTNHFEAELLFYRSFAFIRLNKVDNARHDLERVIRINPEFAEAHYNLSLLYLEIGERVEALQRAKQATELKPENDQFASLYERLSAEE